MKAATRVTSKGQVVIPKPLRDQLRWASGTRLAVEVMDDRALRLALLETEDPIDILYGCLKDLPGCATSSRKNAGPAQPGASSLSASSSVSRKAFGSIAG
jgi:AbrB family looped-hinge helix DNA binding protein